MATQEIGRAEWPPFFDAWSSIHRGWPVTIERHKLGRPQGEKAVVKAFEVPLEEITTADEDTISIVLAGAPGEDRHHLIEDVVRVRLTENEAAREGTLELASRDGARTVVRYRSLPLPIPDEFLA